MINRLLLVEDDTLLAEQTAQALTYRGVQVEQAHSFNQARQQLETITTLDAAVVDQNLGKESGLDLIAPLLHHFPDCRVLLLTGYGSITAAVAATHRGAHNYLTKPASADNILHSLTTDPTTTTRALPDAPPSLQRLEWEHIQRTLDAHGGNISRTADALGIHRRTLQRRLKKRPSASDYRRDRNPY